MTALSILLGVSLTINLLLIIVLLRDPLEESEPPLPLTECDYLGAHSGKAHMQPDGSWSYVCERCGFVTRAREEEIDWQ